MNRVPGFDAVRRWGARVDTYRGPRLVLVALSLSLLALPLAIYKPGLPPTLKADEPAYFLAALSLVHDFDLRIDVADQRRLFEVYPYLPAENLIIMSSDGWQSLYYGKPYLVSLLAAPLVALFGVDGALVLNVVLFLAMLAMGFSWLRRANADWLAAFFVVGFFFFSSAWSYVFWIHPEVLCMFATCSCLFFGLAAVEHLASVGPGHNEERPWRLVGRLGAHKALAVSAGCLALGVYNKPMLAAIGLPVCIELLFARRLRGLLVWVSAAVLSMLAICGLAWALTGAPTPYLVQHRGGFMMYDASQPVMSPEIAEEMWGAAADGAVGVEGSAGWWWMFRVPDTKWIELREDLVYFFFGRHTGLFLYMPFALLSLLLFLAYQRTRTGWLLLGAMASVAAVFLIWIPFNWHGGGGFVGNRYFVTVYPAFLFVVRRIRPAASVVVFWAVAGWLVGPLVLAPFGLVVPNPTLQAHVRNASFDVFPFEFSLGTRLPGYADAVQGETWVRGRKDTLQVVDTAGVDEVWLRGGGAINVWLYCSEPLERAVLELRAPMEGQVAKLQLGGVEQEVTLGKDWMRLTFAQPRVHKVRRDRSATDYFKFVDSWIYRLEVDLQRGRYPHWDGEGGLPFYLGAELRFLGEAAPDTQSLGMSQ